VQFPVSFVSKKDAGLGQVTLACQSAVQVLLSVGQRQTKIVDLCVAKEEKQKNKNRREYKVVNSKLIFFLDF
jgi:hypothetical protein